MFHLAHVPVLEESLFRHMRLLEVDAEFQVPEHYFFNQLFAEKISVKSGEQLSGKGGNNIHYVLML